MDVLSNPTAKLSKSQIWGFEVAHLLIAVVTMLTSNTVFSILGVPVIFSWAVGIVCLLTLRVVSHGKKLGHVSFIFQRFANAPILLGSRVNLKKEVVE